MIRKDRIAQIVSRYVGMGLIALATAIASRLGFEIPEDAVLLIDNFAIAVGAFVAGLVGVFIIDPVIHKLNNGGFLDAPEEFGKRSPTEARWNREGKK